LNVEGPLSIRSLTTTRNIEAHEGLRFDRREVADDAFVRVTERRDRTFQFVFKISPERLDLAACVIEIE